MSLFESTGPTDWTLNWRKASKGFSVFGCVVDVGSATKPATCGAAPAELATLYRGGLVMAVLPFCGKHTDLAHKGGVTGYRMQLGGVSVSLA